MNSVHWDHFLCWEPLQYLHTSIHWRWMGIYIFYHHHHHHHVVLLTQISLKLSCHFSLSFIASARSSGLHPVSSQSCCMYVRAGRPAFARPYVWVHTSTSFMSSTLLPQQCTACLVRLAWIVFVMGGWWPYSWFFVGCCRQDLFKIARNILRAAAGIGLHVNEHKTEYMLYNQTGDISTLDGTSLKLVDKFTCLGSSLINRKRHRHTANECMESYR